MKATLVLTTLLGAAIANPVAIANIEGTNKEKRDAELEARVLPGLATIPLSSLSGLSSLQGVNLPGLPVGAVNPQNVIATLTLLLQGIVSAILNIRQAIPAVGSNPSLPPVPSFPSVPSPTLGTNIGIDQLGSLVGALKIQVQNVTTIGQNLPGGLSLAQLQQIQTIVTFIQSQIGPLITVLQGLSSLPNGTPVPSTGIPGLGGLSSVTVLLSPVLAVVSGLLGPLLGGLLSGLLSGGGGGSGNILSNLLNGGRP
ncbi:hypothetical protein CTA2_4366 [Colletotrichum tanaceti]|uniref:Uncharacterized protein n=1 Tax=Colletotrichum tanaceti TaxID=1306861 RepID=A0A4U6X901_9PEZI|nr:hypothetical protein CTA2_4366 [Colletotrichum tanaceti]TKW52058.1 hypothetical protein CTA1_12232 [Colletotrichum tanaceti]